MIMNAFSSKYVSTSVLQSKSREWMFYGSIPFVHLDGLRELSVWFGEIFEMRVR